MKSECEETVKKINESLDGILSALDRMLETRQKTISAIEKAIGETAIVFSSLKKTMEEK